MRPRVFISELLPEKKSYLPILYPNLGRQYKPSRLFLDKAYDVLKDPVLDIKLDPASADFLMIPYDYFNIEKSKSYISNFEELSRKFGKKILIFDFSDFDKQIIVNNSIQFRVSTYKFAKRTNEIAMPPFIEDLAPFEPRHKGTVPRVGFVGFSKFSWRAFLPLGARRPGLFFRRKAIKILRKSDAVEALFIERPSYSGHVDTIGDNPEQKRAEYLGNIRNSDLVLCPKGDGNYSLRFYETLALGRVPLLIDTDMSLPLEHEVDYSKFTLRLDYREIRRLPELISKWWENLSEGDYVSMQQVARKVFEEKLRMDKFLNRIFSQLLVKNK